MATPRSLADDILNDDQQRAKLNDVLTRFEGECVELGLAACLATVRRLKETLAQGKGNNQQLFSLGDELQGRLVDEMKGNLFFH